MNTLLLVIDDMIPAYGSVSHLSTVVPTPNLDRLARRGTALTGAYTPAPLCNPARTALFTGLYPHNSGVYNNGQWWRAALPEHVTLFEHFKSRGYRVEGAGKVYHHTPGFNPPEQWHEYQDLRYDDLERERDEVLREKGALLEARRWYFAKNTLWREACRVPFIFAGPGVPEGEVAGDDEEYPIR